MNECVKCGSDSRGRKYCYSCSDLRSNLCSVVNQNKKKLAKLCTGRTSYSDEWIYKFNLYVNNIKECLKGLDEFNKADVEFYRSSNKEKDSE